MRPCNLSQTLSLAGKAENRSDLNGEVEKTNINGFEDSNGYYKTNRQN